MLMKDLSQIPLCVCGLMSNSDNLSLVFSCNYFIHIVFFSVICAPGFDVLCTQFNLMHLGTS